MLITKRKIYSTINNKQKFRCQKLQRNIFFNFRLNAHQQLFPSLRSTHLALKVAKSTICYREWLFLTAMPKRFICCLIKILLINSGDCKFHTVYVGVYCLWLTIHFINQHRNKKQFSRSLGAWRWNPTTIVEHTLKGKQLLNLRPPIHKKVAHLHCKLFNANSRGTRSTRPDAKKVFCLCFINASAHVARDLKIHIAFRGSGCNLFNSKLS